VGFAQNLPDSCADLLALAGIGLVEHKWDQRFESVFLQQ
jgi:hypothetical protein